MSTVPVVPARRRPCGGSGPADALADFEGRSYRGWHHHVTLVSVAHGHEAMRATATRFRVV